MNPRFLIPALAVFLLAAPCVSAEEVLHFTNGTHMAVQSHEVRGEMIYVRLGGNAKIAFPVDQVEKVTAGGKEILLQGSVDGRNVMVRSSASQVSTSGRIARSGFSASNTNRRVATGRAGNAADRAMEKLMDGEQSFEERAGIRRPMATSINRRARQMTEVGNTSQFNNRNGSSTPGTTRIGNKTIIRQSPEGPPKPETTQLEYEMNPIYQKLKLQKLAKEAAARKAGGSSSSSSQAGSGN